MAAVQPIRRQSFETIYDLLRTSLLSRKPISATYNGKFRLLCPHIMGRNKDDVPYALCYQFGGKSNSGLKETRICRQLALSLRRKAHRRAVD